MHIIAIISRDLEKGSTKYRLVQYLDFLSRRGITVEFMKRKAIGASAIKKALQADLMFQKFRFLIFNELKKEDF